MMSQITITPIGQVRNGVREQTDEEWGEVVSRLMIQAPFSHGLKGLDQFSHAIVLTFLDKASFDLARDIVRRPRGLSSMPEVGIFAQRAKDRPNPIGITAVQILAVGEDFVEVKGLDAIDGTPIIDIKPYYPHYDSVGQPVVPEWVDRLMQDYF
jgi:tRNA (adenine37-N6)-methyltransferase